MFNLTGNLPCRFLERLHGIESEFADDRGRQAMAIPMIPVTFDACAGWLHEAEGARGVILVPAQGFEHLCSRHAWRLLADRTAAAGLPTLRMDYHGTGDSAGSDLDPDRVPTWTGNIAAAIEWMKANTGIREVALIGLRVGALLALPVAAAREDVTRLALVAPPQSGAAYGREMLVLSRVLGSATQETAQPDEPNGLSVAGFRITEPTLAALKALDPLALERRPAPSVLIMGPEGARQATRIGTHLEALGAQVRHEVFGGYQQMMSDPTAAQVPEASLDRLAAWLAQDPPAARAGRPPLAATPLQDRAWTETGVRIGPDGATAGVHCAPSLVGAPRRAVIFLNGGGIYHVGWARLHVEVARRLAAAGVGSLRLDLPGTGDASAWPGPRRMTFYDPSTDHVRAAIDWLTAQGYAHVTIAGACSGAHHAFHTAVADPRVDGLVLLNTLCFVWGPRYALPLNAWRLSRPHEVASKKRVLGPAEAEPASFLETVIDKSLPGMKVAARGLLEAVKTGVAPLSRSSNPANAGENEVERRFASLASRGTKILLVYSEDDPGRTELERYMGPDGCRATALPGIEMELIPDADHALTPAAARARFGDLVVAFAAGQGGSPDESRSSPDKGHFPGDGGGFTCPSLTAAG